MGIHWNDLQEDKRNELIVKSLEIYHQTVTYKLFDEIVSLLNKVHPKRKINPQKLYGFSNHQKSKDFFSQKMALGKSADHEIINIKHALLSKSVFVLRKIVNQIIEDYGPISQIRCELSVDLKINRMQRFIYRMDQRRIAQNNKRYVEQLRTQGVDVLPTNLLKLELWEECQQTCPYSGHLIPLEMLFTPHVSIVYIHPWSRSLNDSRLNKTLCFTSIAEQLQNRTPIEYFLEENVEPWEQVKTRVFKLFSSSKYHPVAYKKYKRFIKKYNQRDLIKRQFNDPHQYSRQVASFLHQVTHDVQMIPGNITQQLIEECLLVNAFPNRNIENDYRAGILRAYANAICTPEQVDFIAKKNKYNREYSRLKFPLPKGDYIADLSTKISHVLVTHQQNIRVVSTRKVYLKKGKKAYKQFALKGTLHKETLYGNRTAPQMKSALHIRRSIASLDTLTQIEKIADTTLKTQIKKQLKGTSISSGKFNKELLMQFDNEGYPKPQIYIPNKKGAPVPVYKVRMRENFTFPVQLKPNTNRFVVPRNNHHIMVYQNQMGEFQEEVVTFWQAVQRYRNGQPIYRKIEESQGKIITYMHINDLYLLGIDEEEEDLQYLPKSQLRKHLYRIQKLSSFYYEFRLAYRQITPTYDATEYVRINNFGGRKTGWKTYKPLKVKVSVTGKLLIDHSKTI